MRTEYRQALAQAQDQPDPGDRIASIKRAVVAEVRAADPAVDVKTTNYFNHTFAPDMVLSWPREAAERLVFIRPQASLRWLRDDLEVVSPHGAVLFTLEDISGRHGAAAAEAGARSELDAAASQSATWVTDPSGIGAISSARTESPELGLLSQALVRGGRGLADREHVENLTGATAEGFAAATGHVTEATRLAVNALQGGLDDIQAGRLTRVLRAVWEGHGGSASDFPSPSDVGRLTDDDLSYLLEAMIDSPEDFWRRVGRAVTTDQLGRLRVSDPSSSLQALVTANLDRLTAKGLRVLARPHQLGEAELVPRWTVDQGCLALRGLNWTTYLAGRTVEELPKADAADPPGIDRLRARAARRRVPITRVQLGRGDRAVTYESRANVDILEDPELAKVMEDLGGSTVDAASAGIPGGGLVAINFAERSATGHTSAVFPVGPLVRSIVPLVYDLTGDEEAALDALVAVSDEATLFPLE